MINIDTSMDLPQTSWPEVKALSMPHWWAVYGRVQRLVIGPWSGPRLCPKG